ncbi:response regulator [Rothia halotolerans]|uniref:response regulator n=1 Tax=Rothia halotolerans TaxID=405770 RepID=UPI00101C7FFB|nr:response regulator [Rothia halotolerans]
MTPQPLPPPAGTVRVLVVDDEQITASSHAEYIRSLEGFEVAAVAYNAQAAVAALRAEAAAQRPLDLVLLDLTLPDRSGFEVARFIRGADLPVDIIVVTARRDAASLRSASLQGAFGYLVKPFSLTHLHAKLAAYGSFRERLSGGASFAQEDIDRLWGRDGEASSADLPRGLSPETLEAVSRALREAERALSAGEVARMLDLSRVTARRYLEHLHRGSLVGRRGRHGTPGRPEIEYPWIG